MTAIDAKSNEDLIDALAAFPKRLDTLLADRDEADLKRAGPEAGWGVVEILCHLRDTEEVFIERVELMLTENTPRLQPSDHTLWPIDRDYFGQDPGEVLESFSEYRRTIVEILDDMHITDWERIGLHPEYQQITIRQYVGLIVRHDAEHEQQIMAALRETE